MKEDGVMKELRSIRREISEECGGTMEGIIAFLKKREKENVRNGVFCPGGSGESRCAAEEQAGYRVKTRETKLPIFG